ncbi:MAG: hypothetical protein K6B75_05175, partial [Lachnospiraceae bacterium]|nr:hypothetical protein [Lachnospiraceae bacterium]
MSNIFTRWFRKIKENRVRRHALRSTAEENEFLIRSNNVGTPEGRKAFVQGNCEIINESRRQNLEAKKEYEVVTAYLADMQRIDMMNEKARAEVKDNAMRLKNLNEERDQMQRTPSKITAAQRAAIKPYEDEMQDEIRRLEDTERYGLIIKKDMEFIGDEKDSIDEDMETLASKIETEGKLCVAVVAFSAVLALVVLVIGGLYERDV